MDDPGSISDPSPDQPMRPFHTGFTLKRYVAAALQNVFLETDKKPRGQPTVNIVFVQTDKNISENPT